MTTQYTALIKLVLDKSEFDEELKKPRELKIKTEAQIDERDLEIQIQKFRNAFENMTNNKPIEILDSDRVQGDIDEVNKLFDALNSGTEHAGQNIKEMKLALDNLKASMTSATAKGQSTSLIGDVPSVKLKVDISDEDLAQKVALLREKLNRMLAGKPIAILNKAAIKKEIEDVKSSLNSLGTRQGDLKTNTDQTTLAFSKLQTGLKQAGGAGYGFITMLEIAAKKMVVWLAMGDVLFTVIREIKAGEQFIRDLDKEMTNAAVVTGATTAELNKMKDGYVALAKETGTTTLEVAKGSVEWLRQGKSAEETALLLKNSMMMSKLAALDSGQATEYMTSIMNGFNLKAEDMAGVLDTLVALDNSYATSVGEIAGAMQKTAVGAQQAGVSLNELASYIAVVSSVTRDSSENIGVAFKTIFARLGDVKLGKDFDDMGESISNVDATLKRYGITLRDASTGEFRNMADILEEIGAKWKTLGNTEQAEIAKAVSGIHQREKFLVLMENWNKVLEAQVVGTNNAGLSTERYAKYMEGLEAKTNAFKVAMEEMWIKTLSGGVVGGVIDFGTAIAGLVGDVGGLVPLIIALAGAFLLLKFDTAVLGVGNLISGIKSIPGFISAVIGSFKLLSVALAATTAEMAVATVGISLIAGAVALMVYNIATSVSELEKATEKLEKITTNISDITSKISKNRSDISSLNELVSKYEELSAVTNKNVAQNKEFIDVQNKISDILKTVDGSYDENGNFIIRNVDSVKKLIAIKKEENKAYIDSLKSKKDELMDITKTQYEAEVKKMNSLAVRPSGAGMEASAQQIREWKASVAEQKLIVEEARLNLKKLTDEQLAKVPDSITENMKKTGDAIKQVGDKIKEAFNMDATISKLSEDIDKTTDIYKSFQENGKLDIDQMGKLQDIFPDSYMEMLSVVNGKVILNTEAYKKQSLALAEKTLQTAKDNNASKEQKEIITAYIAQLKDEFTALDNIAKIKKAEETIKNDKKLLDDSLKDYKKHLEEKQKADEKTRDAGKDKIDDVIDAERRAKDIEIDLEQARSEQVLRNLELEKRDSDRNFELRKRDLEQEKEAKIRALDDSVNNLEVEKKKIEKTHELKTRDLEEESKLRDRAFEQQKAYIDEQHDDAVYAFEEESKLRNRALEEKLAQIDKEHEARKDALQSELAAYEKIVNARKESLTEQQDTRGFNQDVDAKNKEISDIQSELADIQFDTSEEAASRRLTLEEELAQKQQDLQNLQYDHGVELQQNALDKELEDYKDSIEEKQKIEDADYKRRQELIDAETQRLQDSLDARKKSIEDNYNAEKAKVEQEDKDYQDSIDKRKQAIDDMYEQQKTNIDNEIQYRKDAIEKQKEMINDDYQWKLDKLDDEKYLIDNNFEDRVTKERYVTEDAKKEIEKRHKDREEELVASKEEWDEWYENQQEKREIDTNNFETEIQKQKDAIDSAFDVISNKGTSTWGTLTEAAKKYFEYINGQNFKPDIVPGEGNGVNPQTQRYYQSIMVDGKTQYKNIITGQIIDVSAYYGLPAYHSGLDAGFVGENSPSNSNEEFAKLMKGELVINPGQMDDFMKNILPGITGNNSTISIENLINVEGNVDKNVVGDLKGVTEKVTKEIMDIMRSRGMTRNAKLYAL